MTGFPTLSQAICTERAYGTTLSQAICTERAYGNDDHPHHGNVAFKCQVHQAQRPPSTGTDAGQVFAPVAVGRLHLDASLQPRPMTMPPAAAGRYVHWADCDWPHLGQVGEALVQQGARAGGGGEDVGGAEDQLQPAHAHAPHVVGPGALDHGAPRPPPGARPRGKLSAR